MKKIYYDVINNKGKVEYSNSWSYKYQLQGLIDMLKGYNMIVIIR